MDFKSNTKENALVGCVVAIWFMDLLQQCQSIGLASVAMLPVLFLGGVWLERYCFPGAVHAATAVPTLVIATVMRGTEKSLSSTLQITAIGCSVMLLLQAATGLEVWQRCSYRSAYLQMAAVFAIIAIVSWQWHYGGSKNRLSDDDSRSSGLSTSACLAGLATDLVFRNLFLPFVSAARTFSKSEGAIVSQGFALVTAYALLESLAPSHSISEDGTCDGHETDAKGVTATEVDIVAAVSACGLSGVSWTVVATLTAAEALRYSAVSSSSPLDLKARAAGERSRRSLFSLTTVTLYSILIGGCMLTVCWVDILLRKWHQPRSLWWLLHFLIDERSSEMQQSVQPTVTDRFSMELPTAARAEEIPTEVPPRVAIIVLWVVALSAFLMIMNVGNYDHARNEVSTGMSTSRWLTTPGWLSRKIVVRKWFHVLVCILFLPVAGTDPALLSLAYAAATSLLVLFEAIRVCGLCGPLGAALRRFYDRFVDDRETSGVSSSSCLLSDATRFQQHQLVLTPLYLLVGCAVPHWTTYRMVARSATRCSVEQFLINPDRTASVASIKVFDSLAGIIVLGVGDAAAAIGGSAFGSTLWRSDRSCGELASKVKRSDNRTLEGSATAFVAMLVTSLAVAWALELSTLLHIPVPPDHVHDSPAFEFDGLYGSGTPVRLEVAFAALSLPRLLFALFLATLLEAHANQIDNLVLPIYGSLLLSRATYLAHGSY